MDLLILEEFQRLFKDRRYLHRRSGQGDLVARMFYEDLYALNRSKTFQECVDERHCVVNTSNTVTGKKSRRGDGLFGEALPGSTPELQPGCNVAVGPTANIQVGAEVKIFGKAMVKQIDRVINDLRHQASVFRETNPSAIAIGIVGVNHAEKYVSYEGDRPYPAEGREAPAREAPRIIERLKNEAKPLYDEFLILPFQATNTDSYPFAWINLPSTEQETNAALLRTLRLYEARFR